MAPRSTSALLESLRTALPEMVEQIEVMVACESPSTDLDAVSRSAQLVAALGSSRLGAPAEDLVIDGCAHLRWKWGDGRRRVLVLCHHDTVWPIGSLRQCPVGTHDGILRGPGCLDMKAGIVMAFQALAAVGELDGVTLLVTGDEELGSPTSRELIEAEARECGAALVLEAAAPDGALKVERKGRALYKIAVAGRAAHAGLEPEKGINAAVELAHQILATQGLANVTTRTTVTPSLLSAGSSANTVPDMASFSLDIRAVSAAELDRVDAALRGLLPVLPGARLTVTGGIDRLPLERGMSAALFEMVKEIGGTIGLSDLQGASVGGGSDGNLTAALGTPTLDGLGAVGEGIHTEREHVVVDELPLRTALVALLVQRLQRDGVGGDVTV
jgi:glutamate carboxypeptidase